MTHDLGYPEESRDLELRLVFEIKLAFSPIHVQIKPKPILGSIPSSEKPI